MWLAIPITDLGWRGVYISNSRYNEVTDERVSSGTEIPKNMISQVKEKGLCGLDRDGNSEEYDKPGEGQGSCGHSGENGRINFLGRAGAQRNENDEERHAEPETEERQVVANQFNPSSNRTFRHIARGRVVGYGRSLLTSKQEQSRNNVGRLIEARNLMTRVIDLRKKVLEKSIPRSRIRDLC